MQKIDRQIYDSMSKVLQANGQFEQVTQSFCDNNEKRINDLLLAIKNRNDLHIASTAHALKGSCALFGAQICADLCQKIEAICKTSNDAKYDEALQIIECLKIELQDVIRFIRREPQNGRPECCP